MALPLISIVVNVHNGERFIEQCLDSVLTLQGGFPLQVIVLDDCSTDGTQHVLRTCRDPRIVHVRLPTNVGAAAAISHAFSIVTGEFVGRIDYDDRYWPNFLIESVAALQRHPAAAFVCARVRMIDEEGRGGGFAGPADFGERTGVEDRFISMLRDHFVTAPTILGRTSHWRRAVPVPQGMDFCDWYMNLAMAETAPVVVIDSVTADYRIHPLNMHTTKIRSRMGERVTFDVLQRFLFDTPRASETQPYAHSILALHHAKWGDNYFSAGMDADALRCYGRAIAIAPKLAVTGKFLRRYIGLMFGRQRYERAKGVAARLRNRRL